MSDNPKVKQFEGTAPVNGKVTPTLRQPIRELSPDKWTDMSSEQLWEQRSILETRIQYARNANSYAMVTQLERGLLSLDAIINQKPNDDVGLL